MHGGFVYETYYMLIFAVETCTLIFHLVKLILFRELSNRLIFVCENCSILIFSS